MIKNKKNNKFKAVNWNSTTNKYSKIFWDQNVRQFWIDEEIPLSGDKICWDSQITKEEKEVFKKVLVGLTLLDTHQGSLGMANIASAIDDFQIVAVLQFMAMMENMHAKSYSSIFSTLCTTNEINELFKWAEDNELLQNKIKIIAKYYTEIEDNETLYMAMTASVFLESFLFYSGFYFILLLTGRGQLVNSGEIINLIIRDEAIHGLYVGLLSMDLLKKFSKEKQQELKNKTIKLLNELMENEIEYTRLIYSTLSLEEDVYKFLEYNANKALQNLGYEPIYKTTAKDINPIIFNGLKTTTRNHDFFSTKGNGYIKTTKVEEITDEDFLV